MLLRSTVAEAPGGCPATPPSLCADDFGLPHSWCPEGSWTAPGLADAFQRESSESDNAFNVLATEAHCVAPATNHHRLQGKGHGLHSLMEGKPENLWPHFRTGTLRWRERPRRAAGLRVMWVGTGTRHQAVTPLRIHSMSPEGSRQALVDQGLEGKPVRF